MQEKHVSRRDFSRLALAAAGGIAAGSVAAFAQEGSATRDSKEKKDEFPVDAKLLLEDPNVCRGLNTCQGKGKGDHACAGQGACATVEAHACHGTNDCKGQGGCGGYPGQNTCSEKGHCAVPLGEKAWATARKQFEHLMKDLDKLFGPAPAA
jgi:hypothetical protein